MFLDLTRIGNNWCEVNIYPLYIFQISLHTEKCYQQWIKTLQHQMSAAAPAERRRRRAPVHNKTQTVTCEKRNTFYISSELTEGFKKKDLPERFLQILLTTYFRNSHLRKYNVMTIIKFLELRPRINVFVVPNQSLGTI